MVKKKAPFIPITIIVLGVGFIWGMNARTHPVDPQEEMKRKMAAAGQDSHPKDDPTAVQDALSAAVKRKANGPPKGDVDPSTPSRAPSADVASGGNSYMLAPKPQQYRPQPNPVSASGQWYEKPK